ncbi:hypothetical protein K7432_009035 [Basidiobolus ranarum]|uniref:Uncharacterized protein n=1 Tax=Basidiobolus ranarum TaxID=34480 RepID=A0ABR2VXP3_9FUNG
MSDNLAIVITGCDTGIGAEITEDLYQRGGFIIYATCLTQAAVNRYKSLNSFRVRASIVDVTKQADVDKLQILVEHENPLGIYCLLNNAGVNDGSFFDLTNVESYERTMQVNYLGLVRMTKALLPSLRTYAKTRLNTCLPRARLLCITSIAGSINIPGVSGYCASKHAAESFLDTIRVELKPWEINVSILEPCGTKTPLCAAMSSNFERIWKNAPLLVQNMYGMQFMEITRNACDQSYKDAMPTQKVADAAVRVIMQSHYNQTRCVIGPWWFGIMIFINSWIPTKLMDSLTCITMRKNGTWPSDPFLLNESKQK